MRFLCFSLLLLLFTPSLGHVVKIFDAPGPEVSGLASGGNLLWVLDPYNDAVFGYEYPQVAPSIVKTIEVPFDNPDNLAYADGKLYMTDGTSTVIHSVTVEGEVWSTVDVAGLGIQSIDDLGYEAHSYDANRCMLVLDSSQELVFNIFPLDTFTTIETVTSVADAPQCYGITGGGDEMPGVWVACGSENENIQVWDQGIPTFWWSIETASMVTEIAQGNEQLQTYEFMWVYDQTLNKVLLEYYGLALEPSSWGEIKASL